MNKLQEDINNIPETVQQDTQTSMVSTICYNCVFADYENNIQTGCKANRLELFKKHQVDIKETEIEDRQCFVIEGKSCVYYRNKEWVIENYKTEDVNIALDTIKKQLRIPYHALVFFRSEDTIEDLQKRLYELENQKVKPKLVTVIDRSHNSEAITGELIKTFHNKYSFDHWRVQRIQAVDQIDNDIIDLVYDSTKKQVYMFYIIFECSYDIPEKFSEDIHRSLHDEMKNFTILLPNKNGVGRGALKIAHEKYAGNSFGIDLADKIIHYGDAPHMIKAVEEICPSLQ